MNRIYLALSASLLLSACQNLSPLDGKSQQAAPVIRAEIAKQGLLDCYAADTLDTKGKPVFCEASAVHAQHDSAIITNDKPFQVTSFMQFTLDLTQRDVKKQLPIYLSHDALATAIKVESMSGTPDGKWVFASSAFDRYDANAPRHDNYNMLLVWPAGQPAQAKIVEASNRDGVVSSSEIHKRIALHLGEPYFKIEGLTTLPGNRLVFGVRESGQSYKDFKYRFLLIETNYSIDASGNWQLGKKFNTLLDYSPTADLKLPVGLGLSSLEYNATTQQIFALTSVEDQDKLGAYLWTIKLADLDAPRSPKVNPTLVLTADGLPLYLNSKGEGMSFIDANTLLVVHDNDRHVGGTTGRQPHQAPYHILNILH